MRSIINNYGPLSRLWIVILSITLCFATKYAGEFQELIAGARVCGMGGTGVAQGIDPSSIILNPANAPFINRSLHLMHSENLSGIVKNEFGGITIPKQDVAYGIGFQMVSVGNIKLTTLPDTTKEIGDENQPFPYDTVSTKDMIFYLNAGKIKNKFAFGTNLKIYYRDLAVLTGFGGGIDIGLKLNLKNLNVGASVNNIILSPIYWDSKTKENIEPKFSFGVASLIPLPRINSLLTIELDIIKDLPLNDLSLKTGIELTYQNKIYGRLGKSDSRYTAGAGFRYKKLIFDFGFITHSDLGISNKFSLGVVF